MKKLQYLVVAMLAFLSTSCEDNDSFSASTANLLTFSADTVSMDTVFSTVPSAAKSFWVHNNSGDGIRCTSVALEQGSKSGFRVNVDGTYLSSAAGYATSGVELRKGDSLRVFVEITSKTNGADTPQLVEDNLTFTLESGVKQRVNLNAYSWDATKMSGVTFLTDTTLSGTKPIVVYDSLVVAEGATLTLAAGTTLYFHSGAGLSVHGRLRALGEAGNDVVLRGDRLDYMFDYLPYDLMSGQWNGITFHATSFENELNYTDIHSTFNGIVCDSSDVNTTKLTLSNVTVHNCQGYGLLAENCKLSLENCQLTNAMSGSVYVLGGDVTMNFCTLAQFYPFDSSRGAALNFRSTEATPLIRMDFINGIVTGFDDDQVMGSRDKDSTTFNYRFISSILRTPEVTDTVHMQDIQYENTEDTAAVQGAKHFVLVNHNTQHYDFHLSEQSTAINRGNTGWSLATDRDGNARDSLPDLGCFERTKE